MNWLSHLSLFLLGVSSILPLINPVGTALIISPYFDGSSVSDRKAYSAKVAIYSFLLGLGALLLGSWLLKFMGVNVPTIQLAGGLLVARMGLTLLNAEPPDPEAPPSMVSKAKNSLFYPIAFPLTIGPGGISTLITLSAHVHRDSVEATGFNLFVVSAALAAVCVLTYFCYAYSSVVIQKIGQQGGVIVNRLSAFLVFCIGVQMAIGGLQNTFPNLFK